MKRSRPDFFLIHTCTPIRTHIHANIAYIHICTYIHDAVTCTHTDIQTYICIHTHADIYIYTTPFVLSQMGGARHRRGLALARSTACTLVQGPGKGARTFVCLFVICFFFFFFFVSIFFFYVHKTNLPTV